MQRDSLIYVAGHRGLVGSALMRALAARGYTNIVTRTHAELDLTNQADVQAFFRKEKPEYVFLAAAKVGGIHANSTYPAEFLYQNLMIESNVFQASHTFGVTKLLFLGSSCIYPKHAPQPMKEEYLLSGPLEPTNEAYAVAKIAGIKMARAYNMQFGTNFMSVMPTNLYGPGDNYDLNQSHVIPALIRKVHEAKVRGDGHVVVWGTGTPRREFLYSDDLADACMFLMERHSAEEIREFINVGVGVDLSIRELAEAIVETVGARVRIDFDPSKPDGTPQKLLDVSRLHALGWSARVNIREGIYRTYHDFLTRFRQEGHGGTRP